MSKPLVLYVVFEEVNSAFTPEITAPFRPLSLPLPGALLCYFFVFLNINQRISLTKWKIKTDWNYPIRASFSPLFDVEQFRPLILSHLSLYKLRNNTSLLKNKKNFQTRKFYYCAIQAICEVGINRTCKRNKKCFIANSGEL